MFGYQLLSSLLIKENNLSATLPGNLKYTASHEWIRSETDGTISIGITEHAQELLGDMVFVETPAVGRKLKANEECAVVESVKTASDIYSPMSGEVIEINQAVVDNPGLVNTDPYTNGWFFQLRLSNPDEARQLLSGEDYKKQTHA